MTKKIILSFPAESTGKPLTYDLVKQFDIRINILKASIEVGKTGRLLLELDASPEALGKGIAYLTENGVTVSPLESKITYDKERCLHCGNCASACHSQALSIGAPEWKLQFNPEKCILCKICLVSCPSKLFNIEFAE